MKNSHFWGIFFLTLNGMGFGMIANGGNDDGNPPWMFFSAMFHAEIFLIILFLAGALVYGVFSSDIPSEPEKHSIPPEKTFEIPTPKHIDAKPNVVETRPITPLVVIEPTADELKEKAIQQIIRGW